jgi:hypothetical protein
VRGYIAENVYGGSYSKGTSKCLSGNVRKGMNPSSKDRFISQNQKAFRLQKFRRIADKP